MRKKTDGWKDLLWGRLDWGRRTRDLFDELKRYRGTDVSALKTVEEFEAFLRSTVGDYLIIYRDTVRPNLPPDSLWHATPASKLPSILADALLPTGGEIIPEYGICVFLAQHPNYARFKGGKSEEPIVMLEINRTYLRTNGSNLRPVDTRGHPLTFSKDSLVLARARNGQLEIGHFGRLETGAIRRIYMDENATEVPVQESYDALHKPDILRVRPRVYQDSFMVGQDWNRAIVESCRKPPEPQLTGYQQK